MPTLKELYQQIVAIQDQLKSIVTDLRAAKTACDQACTRASSKNEIQAAYDKYFSDVFRLIQRHQITDKERFLSDIYQKHQKLWLDIVQKIKRSQTNYRYDQSDSLQLENVEKQLIFKYIRNNLSNDESSAKYVEFSAKLNLYAKEIYPFLQAVDQDPNIFKKNIIALCKINPDTFNKNNIKYKNQLPAPILETLIPRLNSTRKELKFMWAMRSKIKESLEADDEEINNEINKKLYSINTIKEEIIQLKKEYLEADNGEINHNDPKINKILDSFTRKPIEAIERANIPYYLPQSLAQQISCEITFDQIRRQCHTDEDCIVALQWAGMQKNETAAFWQNLQVIFKEKGWNVFKITGIPFVEQVGPTCEPTAMFAALHVGEEVPFCPILKTNPSEKLSLNEFPVSTFVNGVEFEVFEKTCKSRSFEARYLNLGQGRFEIIEKDCSQKSPTDNFNQIVKTLKEHNRPLNTALKWGRNNHAILITGYAENIRTGQAFVLYMDPNYAGTTYLKAAETFHPFFLLTVKKTTERPKLQPNLQYNQEWYPGCSLQTQWDDIILKMNNGAIVAQESDCWFVDHYNKAGFTISDFSQEFEIRSIYNSIVSKAISISSVNYDGIPGFEQSKKERFSLAVTGNLEQATHWMQDGVYHQNPVHDFKIRLVIMAAQAGNFDEILKIHNMPVKEIVVTYWDKMLTIYPKLREHPTPAFLTKPKGTVANDNPESFGQAKLSAQTQPQRTVIQTAKNKPQPARVQYQVLEKSLKVAEAPYHQAIEVAQPMKLQPYERSGKDELNRLRPAINEEIKGFAASRGMIKQPSYSNIYKASIISQTSGAAGGMVAGWLGLPTDLGAVTSSLAEQGITVTAQTIDMQGSWLRHSVAQLQQTIKTLHINQQVSGMLNTWRGQAFAFFQRVEGQIIGVYGMMKAGGTLLVHNVWTVVAANAVPASILAGKIVVAVGAVAALGYGISIVLEKFSDFLDEYFADPRLTTTYTPKVKMVGDKTSLEYSCTTALPSEYKSGIASLALAEMNQSPTMPWQAEQKFREFYSKAYIATNAGTNWIAAKEREHLEQREAFNEQKLKEKQLKEKIEIAVKKSAKNAMAVMNYIDQADMLALIIRNDHQDITKMMKPILRGQTKHLADQKTWLEFGYYDKVCAHFCYIMKDIIQLNLAYLKAMMHLEETNFLGNSAQGIATFKKMMQQINFSDYEGVKTGLNSLYKAFYTSAPDQHNPFSNALVDYHNTMINIRDSYEIGLDELKTIHHGLIINNKLSNFLYTLTTQRQALVAEGRKMFGKILEK